MASVWPKSLKCVFNYIQHDKMEINDFNNDSVSPTE